MLIEKNNTPNDGAESTLVDSNTKAVSVQDRIKMAENFFNSLVYYLPVTNNKFGYLWILSEDKKTKRTISFSTNDNFATAIAKKAINLNDDGYNVFIGVNLTDKPMGEYERAKKEKITTQTAIVADIDVENEFWHVSDENKKYPADFDTAKSFLPFEPSILVDSGAGLHAYVLLKKPLQLTTDEEREQAISRNIDYLEMIRQNAGEFASAVDPVHDLPRILRLPGTYNLKHGRKNAPLCRMVEMGNSYTLENLRDLIKPRPITPAKNQPVSKEITDKIFINRNRKNNYSATNNKPSEQKRALAMLEKIPCSQQTYGDWIAVGMILKNNGNSCTDWENWSATDSARYKSGECAEKWATFQDNGGLTIATLHHFARILYDYSEKDFQREWYFDNKISRMLKSVKVKNNSTDRIKRDTCILSAPLDSVKERADIFMGTDTSVTRATKMDLFTLKEAAQYVGVNEKTLRRWNKQKIFEPYLIDHHGDFFYTREELEQLKSVYTKSRNKTYSNVRTMSAGQNVKFSDEDVEKILDWQKHNGEISPDVLKYLKDAKTYLENLKVEDITAGIILSSKTKYAVANCLFYDFYSDVATNFTTRMKLAIQTAKEKVKSANSENPVADEIKSLSSIRPSDFDKAVNVIVTETKTKHKIFLLKLNAEKAKERREQYEQAPSTTRTNCPDCPVNLVLPYQTSFEKSRGIFANDDKGRPKCISRTPLVPTRQFINPAEGTHHYEIAINTHGNEWQKVIYDAESLFNAKNVMNLVNDGARFSSKTAADISEWLATILSIPENQESIQRVDIYNQTGWTDETCTEFIYPQNEEKYLVRTKNFDYEKAFARRGEKTEWLKMFKKVLSKSAVTRLTLGAAFSAPLINVLNIRNLQLHLSCPSGNGKTALIKFATSAYGNPEKFKFKFNGTSNSFETQSTLFNDLPSWLEELQSANKKQRESIDQIIYDYESGIGRGRNTKNNFLQKQKYFRGMRISTGEQNLTNQFSGEGAISRILEITRADIFSNDFAIEVHQFCAENFGHFGQDWINFIIENKSDIRKHFNDLEKSFIASGLMSNHITTLAAAHTALLFFCKMLDIDTESIASLLYSDFIDFVGSGELPSKDRATNANRALQTVAEIVASHPKFFKAEKYDSDTDETKLSNSEDGSAAYDYGFILKNGDIAIYPTALREILKDYPSVDALIRNFAECNYLDCGNDEKRPYQKAAKYQGKTIWVYRFKKSALEN